MFPRRPRRRLAGKGPDGRRDRTTARAHVAFRIARAIAQVFRQLSPERHAMEARRFRAREPSPSRTPSAPRGSPGATNGSDRMEFGAGPRRRSAFQVSDKAGARGVKALRRLTLRAMASGRARAQGSPSGAHIVDPKRLRRSWVASPAPNSVRTAKALIAAGRELGGISIKSSPWRRFQNAFS